MMSSPYPHSIPSTHLCPHMHAHTHTHTRLSHQQTTSPYLTVLSFSMLSCLSNSVCRISCTIRLMPGSATRDIRSSGSRKAVGNAFAINTVLYLVATLSSVFISMVWRSTFLGLQRKFYVIVIKNCAILRYLEWVMLRFMSHPILFF